MPDSEKTWICIFHYSVWKKIDLSNGSDNIAIKKTSPADTQTLFCLSNSTF